MIDDELNNYNDKYEYKVDGNCCQQEILKPCGYQNLWYILIIYYKIWVMAYASIVVESDFICALVDRNMVVRKN